MNTPGAARDFYAHRADSRPVQIWKRAKKDGFPSVRNAAAKGEVGAIPLKSYSK
jgi:hypothetical protein